MNRRACAALTLFLGALACTGVRRDPLGGARAPDGAALDDGATAGDPGDGSAPAGPDGSFPLDTASDVPVREPDSGAVGPPAGTEAGVNAPAAPDTGTPEVPPPNNGGPGQSCIQDKDCTFGHCSRGICCDRACEGLCQSCALPGSQGICVDVTDGPSPTCAGDRTCNPFLECKSAPGVSCSAAAECSSGECKGGRCCVAQCPDFNNLCNSSGVCKLSNTVSCTDDSSCFSSFCTDGRCCSQRACQGDCMLCYGADGTCAAVLAAGVPEIQCGIRNACFMDACRRTIGGECRNSAECMSGTCNDGKCACALCIGPKLEIASFGSVQVGAHGGFAMDVTNASSAPHLIRKVWIWGSNAFKIGFLDCPPGTTLAPGVLCAIDVHFFPTALGSAAATLIVESDQTVAASSLYGEGVDPGAAIIFPSAHFFGEVASGSAYKGATLTIRNPASGTPQPIGVPSLRGRDPGQFQALGADCPVTLPPGQECRFTVIFRPTALGVQLATVVVAGGTAALHGIGK